MKKLKKIERKTKFITIIIYFFAFFNEILFVKYLIFMLHFYLLLKIYKLYLIYFLIKKLTLL